MKIAGVFVCGKIDMPECKCGPDCEFPCWQRVGLTDEPACGSCGCPAPSKQGEKEGRR